MTKIPFDCPRCAAQPKKEFARMPDIDDWVTVYPDEDLIHIHFGRATHSTEESDNEAIWLDHALRKIMGTYPEKKFYAVLDNTRADDSEFPSEKTRQLFRDLLADKQMNKTICYGVTPSMGFLIKMLIHFSGRTKDIFVVKDREAAEIKLAELVKEDKRKK